MQQPDQGRAFEQQAGYQQQQSYNNEPGGGAYSNPQQAMGSNQYAQGAGGQQQGYNNEPSGGAYSNPQQAMGNNQYAQGAGGQQHGYNNEPSGGAYDNPQQGMGNNQHAQGAGGQQQQQTGGAPDNRDTMSKWLDKIEKKFGGERFNNPENAEKNQKLNESILKRLKQVAKMAMQRGPGMVMRMVR